MKTGPHLSSSELRAAAERALLKTMLKVLDEDKPHLLDGSVFSDAIGNMDEEIEKVILSRSVPYSEEEKTFYIQSLYDGEWRDPNNLVGFQLERLDKVLKIFFNG